MEGSIDFLWLMFFFLISLSFFFILSTFLFLVLVDVTVVAAIILVATAICVFVAFVHVLIFVCEWLVAIAILGNDSKGEGWLVIWTAITAPR